MATFFDPADSPYIASCLNLSVTVISLQQQWPLKPVPNCQNNLLTKVSFLATDEKTKNGQEIWSVWHIDAW